MGIFDRFKKKSSADVIQDEMRKLAPILFPGGHEQIVNAGKTISAMLDLRIRPEDASRIYSSAKYLAHTSQDKSRGRMVAYLVSKGMGRISNDEAAQIYERLIAQDLRPREAGNTTPQEEQAVLIDAGLENTEYRLQNTGRSIRVSAVLFTVLLVGLRSTGWHGAANLFEPRGNVLKSLAGRYDVSERDALELATQLKVLAESNGMGSEEMALVLELAHFAREGAFSLHA